MLKVVIVLQLELHHMLKVIVLVLMEIIHMLKVLIHMHKIVTHMHKVILHVQMVLHHIQGDMVDLAVKMLYHLVFHHLIIRETILIKQSVMGHWLINLPF